MSESKPENVVAGCWCTSFEQNLYRPSVCLACFHKKNEHNLPNSYVYLPLRQHVVTGNSACSWKNVPKPDFKSSPKPLSPNRSFAATSASISPPPSTSLSSSTSTSTSSSTVPSPSPSLPPPPPPSSSPSPSASFASTSVSSTSATPSPPTPTPASPVIVRRSPAESTSNAASSAGSSLFSVRRKTSSESSQPATKVITKPSDNPSWVSRSYAKSQSGSSAPVISKGVTSTSSPSLLKPIPAQSSQSPQAQQSPSSPRGGSDQTQEAFPITEPSSVTTRSSFANTRTVAFSVPSSGAQNANANASSSGPIFTSTPTSPSLKGITPKVTRRNAVVISQSKKNVVQEYSALQNFDAQEILNRMIRSLVWMNGISVDERFVKEFLSKLEVESSKVNHTTSTNTSVPLWDKRHILDQCLLGMSIKADIEHVLHHHTQVQKIVIVQSCARRYLVKRKVENLKQYQQSPWKERNSIFRDLLRAERGYMSNLSLMVMGYMNPLKVSQRNSVFLSSWTHTAISAEDLQSIFCNVDVLLRVHTTILGEFEMLTDRWPVIEEIGATFLKKASEFRVYGEYVRNFQNALHTLTRLQEENSKFAQFLAERIQRNFGDPGLMSLISCPLNQISQYAILLERLVHATPSSHSDHEKLTAASILMKEIYKLLQESIEQTNNRAKMMDLQRRILPQSSSDFEVVVPSRHIVIEGAVHVFLKKKKRTYHYVVFNVFPYILLLCRVKKNLFKVKYYYPYSMVVVEEDFPPVLLQPGTDTHSTPACAIVVPKEKIILLFNSSFEIKNFVKAVRPLCEKANPSRRVFGSSLVSLMKREKENAAPSISPATIPSPLVSMVEAIKPNVQVEGIFRVSGTVAAMQAIKESLENGEIDLHAYDVHTIANALKTFFREMPEPLMTFPAFQDLASIAEDQQIDSRLQSLRVVIANMPKINRDVLHYLVTFLAYVAAFSDKNKMNYSNLSIVMGPNLIRPMQNTLETTLMMPKLNSIVADLIEHLGAVFSKMDV